MGFGGKFVERDQARHLRAQSWTLQEIERCRAEAGELFRVLTPEGLRLFVLGLYAGEGSKTQGTVSMANTNALFLRAFVTWLRSEFALDESTTHPAAERNTSTGAPPCCTPARSRTDV